MCYRTPELEENIAIKQMWKHFEPVVYTSVDVPIGKNWGLKIPNNKSQIPKSSRFGIWDL